MLPPLVERELRIALRDARKQWQFTAYSAAAITAFFLVFRNAGLPATGRTLFHVLLAVASLGIVARSFSLTADLFSEERRNGTLGLLVLTGLQPLEIFAHKLFGAVWLVGFSLLGGLPFFAIPFLIGGVTPTEFLCSLVFLVNALVLCVALGLLASVINSEGGQAQLAGVVATAILCGATPIAHWICQASGLTLPADWLALSPAYPGYLVYTSFAGSSVDRFWIGSGCTLVYSLTALLLAAAILHRTWRAEPKELTARSWFHFGKKRSAAQNQSSFAERAPWMSRDPFGWLVARRSGALLAARILVASVTMLWLGGWLLWGGRWTNVVTAFGAATLLHLGLIWILAYAAGDALGEARQTGGLEALLTTPLSVDKLVNGQLRALGLRFRKLFLVVLGVDAILFTASFDFAVAPLASIAAYACVFGVLLYASFAIYRDAISRSMWISAWTGRPVYAATQAILPGWTALIAFFFMMRWLRRFPRNNEADLMSALILVLICIALSAGLFNRTTALWKKLRTELRLIAVAPIPPRRDKRFAGWDPKLIYPPVAGAIFI